MIIQAIHELNPNNQGDIQSCWAEHFNVFENELPVEVEKLDLVKQSDQISSYRPIIVGGGGMFINNQHSNHLESLLKRHVKSFVIWGAGVNNNGVGRNDFIPMWVNNASLAGIRDFKITATCPRKYVPCPSCLHPGFDKDYQIKHSVVCFEGNALNLPLPTHHCNEGMSMDEILTFLGSGKTIVTSSYHGMMWGALLNRQVIVIPNAASSKFYYFPVELPHATVDNWESFIDTGRTYPWLLQSFRELNIEFSKRVEKVLGCELQLKHPIPLMPYA